MTSDEKEVGKIKCPECWETPIGSSPDCATCMMHDMAQRNLELIERIAKALEQLASEVAWQGHRRV